MTYFSKEHQRLNPSSILMYVFLLKMGRKKLNSPHGRRKDFYNNGQKNEQVVNLIFIVNVTVEDCSLSSAGLRIAA
jgi:hypothetical protein